jgi:hypothetical protein
MNFFPSKAYSILLGYKINAALETAFGNKINRSAYLIAIEHLTLPLVNYSGILRLKSLLEMLVSAFIHSFECRLTQAQLMRLLCS